MYLSNYCIYEILDRLYKLGIQSPQKYKTLNKAFLAKQWVNTHKQMQFRVRLPRLVRSSGNGNHSHIIQNPCKNHTQVTSLWFLY